MELRDARRSDRVALELAIEVTGSDAEGRVFVDEGKTLVVNRHGAEILVNRKLVPQQEVTIKCLETGRETVARVVGQIRAEPETTYGVSLVDPETGPWGIEFPPISESHKAVGRVVLECQACHAREVAYLDEFELEVLEANHSLSRPCKRCRDASVWRKSFVEAPVESEAPLPPPVERPPEERRERRREPRRDLRVCACVQSKEFGEDIVMTRNVSRGGACFESKKRYTEGWTVEIAVPYTKGGGNIFVPARIANVRESPPSEVIVYGVQYTGHQR